MSWRAVEGRAQGRHGVTLGRDTSAHQSASAAPSIHTCVSVRHTVFPSSTPPQAFSAATMVLCQEIREARKMYLERAEDAAQQLLNTDLAQVSAPCSPPVAPCSPPVAPGALGGVALKPVAPALIPCLGPAEPSPCPCRLPSWRKPWPSLEGASCPCPRRSCLR